MNSSTKTRVAVIYGGNSGEHEISLLSAASVITHLDQTRFDIIPIGIAKTGQWYLNSLAELENNEKLQVQYPGSITIDTVKSQDCDVIFPVTHGPYYEDGCLQGQLELTSLPYVGCSVLASALAMDKVVSKTLIQAAGIPVIPFISLHKDEWQDSATESQQRIEQTFTYPLFVKPANLGSSVGIHKVKRSQDLAAAINDAMLYDHKLIIEPAIDAREIEIALIENPKQANQAFCSCIGEIITDNKYEFYDYAAKYLDPDNLSLQIPAKISEQQQQQVIQYAQQAFSLLGCQGYGRVDFLMDRNSGEIFFNEINTIPGFTTMSMFPLLWAKKNLSYAELLNRLIELAKIRHQQQQAIKRDWH